MNESTRPADIVRLRDELAAQQARIAALEARVRRHRRALPRLAPAIIALFVALTPLGLLAAHPFNDLTGGVHDADIEAIYEAGVTTGCVPNVSYCPTRTVTREEMASFLARLGGLGTNPPVANALTAQTADNATNATNAANATHATTAETATNATSADDADTVGGLAPDELIRVARTLVPNNFFASPSPQPLIQVTTNFPEFQTIGTVAITAPAEGFVLVMAQVLGISTDGQSVILQLRDTTSGETSPIVGQYVEGSPNVNTTMTPVYLFPVTAGARTFALEATGPDGPMQGLSVVADTVIVAAYFPFGATGGSALGTDPPAPAGSPAPVRPPLLGP